MMKFPIFFVIHLGLSLVGFVLSFLLLHSFFVVVVAHIVVFLAMVFHDFPWGSNLAPWDVALSQQDFNLRVAACDRLNTLKESVSFALCSFWDTGKVREAYQNADWSGGSIGLNIEKLGKIEPTKADYGLINVSQSAVVTFRGKQSEATWSFSADPADRKNVWQVFAEKRKVRDQEGVVNPSEQPVEIDQRAMMHWSRHGEWVFVDGFGSGTTLVAALRSGRSAVGTEPDPRQFQAAVLRLQDFVARAIKEDEADMRTRLEEERLKKKKAKNAREKQILDAKTKKQEARKKKVRSSSWTHFCFREQRRLLSHLLLHLFQPLQLLRKFFIMDISFALARPPQLFLRLTTKLRRLPPLVAHHRSFLFVFSSYVF